MILIFYDLETTGLNPYHEEIIEFTFIKNNIPFTSLVKPSKQIIQKITDITGITNDMLKDAFMINYYSDSILEFINNNENDSEKYLVAHNNDNFDKFFLKEHYKQFPEKYNKTQNWKYIDTILFTKKLLPFFRRHNLKSLCKYFGFPEGTHRSYSDTVALQKLYYKLVEIYCQKKNRNFEEVINNPKEIYDYIY